MFKIEDFVQGELKELETFVAEVGANDTPFLDLVINTTTPANGPVVSWRTEKTEYGTATKGIKEGAEYGEAKKVSRKTLSNICQIFAEFAEVSGTVAATNPEGIQDELANQTKHAIRRIKRDMELALLFGQAKEEDEVSGRELGGLASLVPVENRIEVAKLGKDTIEQAMEKCWEAGAGGDKILYVDAIQKKAIDKLYLDSAVVLENSVVGEVVNVIKTNFGNVYVVLNRHIKPNTLVFLDPTQVELKRLRPLASTKVPTQTDAIKNAIIGEYTLKVNNIYTTALITIQA